MANIRGRKYVMLLVTALVCVLLVGGTASANILYQGADLSRAAPDSNDKTMRVCDREADGATAYTHYIVNQPDYGYGKPTHALFDYSALNDDCNHENWGYSIIAHKTCEQRPGVFNDPCTPNPYMSYDGHYD